MDNLPTIFNYQQHRVRTILIDDQIWFVVNDLCKALDIKDAKQAFERLDEDERGRYGIPTPGGPQTMNCTNEPGLYALIFTSRKPEAKDFKRWIAHEVIPAIRKTGSYSIATEQPACPIHTVTDAMRERVLVNIHSVPDDSFLLSVATFKHFYNLEAILNAALDEKAVPEISVGKLFPPFVEAKLGDCPRRRCAVQLPSGKPGEVWVYPLQLMGMFDRWIWETYVPEHFPTYAHYRAKRVGRPAPRLLLPAKPTLQLPLWDAGCDQEAI